jgi:tetratricopeptide (TPR) repeat protein
MPPFPRILRAPSPADRAIIQRAEMAEMLSRAELEQQLVDEEAAHGPDHPRVGAILSSLGRFLHGIGHLDQAERLLARALVIHERSHSPSAPALAGPLGDLAMVKAWRSPSEAAPLLRRALAIDEQGLGAAHPDLASRLSNLGMVLYDLGEAEESRPLLERALAIRELVKGATSPEVAADLANLALVLKALGAFEEAEALLARAVELAEAAPRSAGPE